MTRTCAGCGAEFEVLTRAGVGGPPRLYCSEACRRTHNIAKTCAKYHATKELRLFRLPMKASVQTCIGCGAGVRSSQTKVLCVDCRTERDRARWRERGNTRSKLRRMARTQGDLSRDQRRELLAAAHSCPVCSVSMSDDGDARNGKTIDHIVPLSHGGADTVANVRVVCRTCNIKRGNRTDDLAGVQIRLDQVDTLAPTTRRVVVVREAQPCRGCGAATVGCAYCSQSCMDADRLRKPAQAYAMRVSGAKWDDVAKVCGYSGPGAAFLAADRVAKMIDEGRFVKSAEGKYPARSIARRLTCCHRFDE